MASGKEVKIVLPSGKVETRRLEAVNVEPGQEVVLEKQKAKSGNCESKGVAFSLGKEIGEGLRSGGYIRKKFLSNFVFWFFALSPLAIWIFFEYLLDFIKTRGQGEGERLSLHHIAPWGTWIICYEGLVLMYISKLLARFFNNLVFVNHLSFAFRCDLKEEFFKTVFWGAFIILFWGGIFVGIVAAFSILLAMASIPVFAIMAILGGFFIFFSLFIVHRVV